MEPTKKTFRSLSENVGSFDLKGKTFLIPEMNRIGCHVMAGAFRSFSINALVMDTYKGLDLGMEYTSGKECYPCQVTLGDILYHMNQEKERLGEAFDPRDYIYFMPEASGPCRFGMYNKLQRIVLDSFPHLRNLKIGALTTDNGYSLEGIIDKTLVSDLRKSSFFSVVVADIMDRLLWRIRPYEKEPGLADAFMEKAMQDMADTFEAFGKKKVFAKILDKLDEIIEQGKTVIDPSIPPKPLIGMVGEIYMRTQVHSNQDLIKVLERHGAEVVNASITEWVNFTSYQRFRDARTGFRLGLKTFRMGKVWENLKKMAKYSGELFYQEFRQKQVYKRIASRIHLPKDHKVAHLENTLKESGVFNFDIGTEACLSISGLLEYAKDGYNGLVNVYPFTCMPSTVTSAIIKPIMNKMGIPYIDTPYDSSFQPGRESAIRTFMYQAQQHLKRHGRRNHVV
ncbi:MAG: CoA activase [Deltaproteobacteria bacterium]|nr:CoA activase [Deltaproteobacteria bacterium]